MTLFVVFEVRGLQIPKSKDGKYRLVASADLDSCATAHILNSYCVVQSVRHGISVGPEKSCACFPQIIKKKSAIVIFLDKKVGSGLIVR